MHTSLPRFAFLLTFAATVSQAQQPDASHTADILAAEPFSIVVGDYKALNVHRVIAISPDCKLIATQSYDFTAKDKNGGSVVHLVETDPKSSAAPKRLFSSHVIHSASWNRAGTKLIINHLSASPGPGFSESLGLAVIDLKTGKTVNLTCKFQENNMIWAEDMAVVYTAHGGQPHRLDLNSLTIEPISWEEYNKVSTTRDCPFRFKRDLGVNDYKRMTFIHKPGYLMAVPFSESVVSDFASNGSFVILSRGEYGNEPVLAYLRSDPGSSKLKWRSEVKMKNSSNVALSEIPLERLRQKATPPKTADGFYDWDKAVVIKFYRPNINPLNDAVISADMNKYVGSGYVFKESQPGEFLVYIYACIEEIQANDVGLLQIPTGFPERTSEPTRRGMLVQ